MPQPLDYHRPHPPDRQTPVGCLLHLLIACGLIFLVPLALWLLALTVTFLLAPFLAPR